MMTAIVAPLGCLRRVRTASCLVPPRVEPGGTALGLVGPFTRFLTRATSVFLGVLPAAFEDPFRLRRHQSPSPPKPHSGGIASGAGSRMGPTGLISAWHSDAPFAEEVHSFLR